MKLLTKNQSRNQEPGGVSFERKRPNQILHLRRFPPNLSSGFTEQQAILRNQGRGRESLDVIRELGCSAWIDKNL